MTMKTMLKEEIREEIEALGKMEVGSEGYEKTVNGLTKLMDRAIEMDKLEVEQEEKEKDREIETDLKILQMEDEKKDRKTRNIISIFGLAIPTGLTIWGTLKSLKFEETGTVTTNAGRAFINKLFRGNK